MTVSADEALRALTERYEFRKILSTRVDARESLLAFSKYTHPAWVTGEHHKKICEALVGFSRGDIRRLMICAPPRHTKSELASVRLPGWHIGRNPTHQIIGASYGDDLAVEFGGDVISLVRSPRYQALFPGFSLRKDSRSKSSWKTEAGGRYHAVGIGGAITGKGAHRLIIDDPIKTRDEADSPAHREKVWRWYWAEARPRLMPGGCILIMQTRWHEDDLAGRLLKMSSEQWEVLSLPAISANENGEEHALWPEWYPLDDLQLLRKQLSEAKRSREWFAQYMQQPTAEEGVFFLRKWFEERWEYGDDTSKVSA
jgi:hypothetical protein